MQAAFSYLFAYVVDRAALFRINQKPPNYDDALAKLWVGLMPYAAMIHIGIAVWTFSDPGVMYSPSVFDSTLDTKIINTVAGDGSAGVVGSFISSTYDSSGLDIISRLSRENTLPLFILFCIVVIGWGLWVTLGHTLLYFIRTTFALITCGNCCM